jgi:hypothetical protein
MAVFRGAMTATDPSCTPFWIPSSKMSSRQVYGFQMVAAHHTGFGHLVWVVPVQNQELVFHGAGQMQVKNNHPLHDFDPFPIPSISLVPLKLVQDALFHIFQYMQEEILLVLEVVKDGSGRRTGEGGKFCHGGALEPVSGKEPGGGGKDCISF